MARQRQDRPNVVVFFTDQQRWDTTGEHGNPLGLTPNFDRMARRGTHLFNTFTCQPVCAPARAALQTGSYPTTTGCFRNGIPLPRDATTLAHHFRAAGYATGYIGKWHLANEDAVGPVAEEWRGGYESWLGANVLEFTSDSYHTTVYDNHGDAVQLPGYRADALTDAAIRYITANAANPFFLFLSLVEPHHQNARDDYPAPDGYEESYRQGWLPPDLAALGGSAYRHLAGYYGMVKRVDEALGRLLDALRSLRLTEDTVVLFTADHGCHFKTRNEEYKRSCHDASIRVPAAFQGPGFDSGGQVRDLVSLVDLPPTLLDAASLPVPQSMQGRSLFTRAGDVAPWPEEVFVQISEAQVGRAVRTHRWKYSATAPGADPWYDPGSGGYVEDCLYDLQADPYELENLVTYASHREVKRRMRDRLLRRMAEAGEKAPTIDNAAERPSGQRSVSAEEAEC